jgi:hypothetical protein
VAPRVKRTHAAFGSSVYVQESTQPAAKGLTMATTRGTVQMVKNVANVAPNLSPGVVPGSGGPEGQAHASVRLASTHAREHAANRQKDNLEVETKGTD